MNDLLSPLGALFGKDRGSMTSTEYPSMSRSRGGAQSLESIFPYSLLAPQMEQRKTGPYIFGGGGGGGGLQGGDALLQAIIRALGQAFPTPGG